MSSNLWIIDSFVCGPLITSLTFKSLSMITVTGRVSGISIPKILYGLVSKEGIFALNLANCSSSSTPTSSSK